MVATVEDGRLTKLRPDSEHPLSQGFACPKGIAMAEVQNDPDRVLHPLRKNEAVFQKTVAINDFYLRGPGGYPLGQIQSQGRTHGVMAQTAVPWIPLWAYDAWVARGVDWLVMSEDLPRDDNRVIVDANGRIQLQYRPNNETAHRGLVNQDPILYALQDRVSWTVGLLLGTVFLLAKVAG